MKKKIAILLATVMAVTAVPVNMFAATTNKLTRTSITLPEKTVLVEEVTGSHGNGIEPKMSGGDSANTDNLKWLAEGTTLRIELDDDIASGSTFSLKLENAAWFFRNDADVTGLSVTVSSSAVAVKHFQSIEKYNTSTGGDGRLFNLRTLISGKNSGINATYDASKGFLGEQTLPTVNDYGTTYYRTVVKDADGADLFNPTTPVVGSPETFSVYKLVASGAENSKATVTMLMPMKKDQIIEIPIICRTTGTGESKVTVVQDSSNVSGGTYAFLNASSTLTKAYVGSVESARTRFPINRLIVEEQRVNSVESGKFEISAPSGFEFDFDPTKGSGTFADRVRLNAESGLSANAALPLEIQSRTDLIKYKVSGTGSSAEEDRSVIVVEIPSGFTASSSQAGRLFITGLMLVADDDAPWGDINLKIRSIVKDPVSSQTFLGGKRTDWTLSLTTKGDIPTLVTGEYDDDDKETGAANADDKFHKTATVIFKENSVSAWWAERKTEFTLPKGVKVRKLEITDAKEIADNVDLEKSNLTTNLKATGYGNYGEYDISGYGDAYPNNAKTYNHVKIDDNVITLEGIKIKADETASIEMDLWVSIEANFTGDVKLALGGSAVPDKIEPVTIAKTIQPVTIDTKVTDIKIGYQYYKVADFTITETKPGMLEKNKEVRVSVSDAISQDMAFTPGFKTEVSNIKIKDEGITSGSLGSAKGTLGQIGKENANLSFKIASESYDKAGVIKFSNMQVKIDRTVPETTVPYDIVVWGTAVAENYGPLKDQFQTAGVKAPYIKVVTSANDKGAITSAVVQVTIDDPVVKVGNESITMDTAAYISPESESTMVPVKFVAVALGVPEDKVMWDPIQRSVTIDASQSNSTRIIQMKVGSDQIVSNGISRTMFSTNMTPVKMEIKDSRSFIPMRALGEALAVPVTWKADTRTAIYNFDKLNETATTTTTTTP